MDKKFIIGFSVAVGLGLLIFLAVISANSVKTKTIDSDQTAIQSADKVQVYLFHATQRCITCITIGKYAGETVYEYFQPELRDGKIEFREINIDLPENKELAQKFQASGSALFVNAIYNGQDSISEDTRVWRLTQDEVQFKSYLKDKLNNLLGK
jgi:hypothetical protein